MPHFIKVAILDCSPCTTSVAFIFSPVRFRSAQYAYSAGLKHSCGLWWSLSGSTYKDTPVPRSFLSFLYPTDNASCSGGTRMMNPCFLGLHSAHEFLLLSYSCQPTKAPLSRHSNAPFGCQKSDRLLFIALFTIFSQTLWVFLFLQQNKPSNTLFPFHFNSLFDILCLHLHCAVFAELQYERVISQICCLKK